MTDPFECPSGPANPEDVTDLYPPGTEPAPTVHSLSALCSYGVTQTVMTGVLRHALGIHFSDPQNILSDKVRKRLRRDGVWRESDQTGLLIESLHRWTPEATEYRPAIILKENAWEWNQLVINDHVATEVRTGKKTYAGQWVGSHTLFVITNEGAEAQTLAWEVMNSLLMAKHEIVHQLQLQKFVPVSIGEVAALQESSEHYLVPVVFAYIVEHAWSMQPEAPRLKRIEWSARSVLADY